MNITKSGVVATISSKVDLLEFSMRKRRRRATSARSTHGGQIGGHQERCCFTSRGGLSLTAQAESARRQTGSPSRLRPGRSNQTRATASWLCSAGFEGTIGVANLSRHTAGSESVHPRPRPGQGPTPRRQRPSKPPHNTEVSFRGKHNRTAARRGRRRTSSHQGPAIRRAIHHGRRASARIVACPALFPRTTPSPPTGVATGPRAEVRTERLAADPGGFGHVADREGDRGEAAAAVVRQRR
jgi:hypothetical protein